MSPPSRHEATPQYAPKHLEYLEKRAVDPSIAWAAGVRSLDASGVAAALGWQTSPSPGLDFPHCRPDGEVLAHRVRLDRPPTGMGKFMAAKGGVVPWLPPRACLIAAGQPAAALANPSLPIVITEGPAKALSLLSGGQLAISLGGVAAGGHDAEHRRATEELRVHPVLSENVTLADRTVVILFDANVATNPNVADGAALNALALTNAGAKVKIATLPLTPDGRDQGPDDFVAEHGHDALAQVIAAAAEGNVEKRVRELLDRTSAKAARRRAVTELLGDRVVVAALRRLPGLRRDALFVDIRERTGLGKKALEQPLEGFRRELARKASKAHERQESSNEHAKVDERPVIRLGPDDHVVVEKALDALKASPNLFEFGGRLVEVVEHRVRGVGYTVAKRAEIQDVAPPRAKELLSRAARFTRKNFTSKKEDAPTKRTPPPLPLAQQVLARGHWPMLRPLVGISEAPLVDLTRRRIVWDRGYDEATATFVAPPAGLRPLEKTPTFPEVEQARDDLLGLVREFPFENETHEAAWLAALLTGIALPGLTGSSPIFAITANSAGVGKTLLAKLVGLVAQGRPPALLPPAERSFKPKNFTPLDLVDDEEMRKRIGALLHAGTAMMLVDNATVLGGTALNALVTAGAGYRDRLLGRSTTVTVQQPPLILATGINLFVLSETRRRTVQIRLRTTDEAPHRRQGFAIENLEEHVAEQRLRYLRAALLLIAGFIAAGCPSQHLPAFGSFRGWSVVRDLVVWAGLPDPLAGPEEDDDPELAQLISVHQLLEHVGAEHQRDAIPSKRLIEQATRDEVVATLLGQVAGQTPDPRALTTVLSRLERRPLGKRWLRRFRTREGVVFYLESAT